MQVTFQPTGEVMNTDLATQQRGPTYPPPPPTPPTVSLEDELTAGTLGAQVQGSNQNYIIWKDRGVESTRDRWPMDSEDAVANGLAVISAQLAAEAAAITIDSAGDLVTPS